MPHQNKPLNVNPLDVFLVALWGVTFAVGLAVAFNMTLIKGK